jgi:thiol-disulfide isomerase/thioredoxin
LRRTGFQSVFNCKLRQRGQKSIMQYHPIKLVLAASVSLLLITGCGPSKKPEAKETPAPAQNSPAPVAPTASAAEAPAAEVITDIDTDLLKPGAKKESPAGDAAWIELQKSLQPPGFPEEWREKQPTMEEVRAFDKKKGMLAAEAAQRAKDFYTKYPDHQMAKRAKQMELLLINESVQLGATNNFARLGELEGEKLKDPNLPEDERFALRAQQLQRRVNAKEQEDTKAGLNEMEKGVRELQKEFPDREEINSLLLAVAQGRLEQNEPEKARTLAEEVLKNKPEQEAGKEAQSLLKKLNLLGKPFELKYSSVDGKEVDVQKFKGKVVLVDFWATWCGPCMRELPHLKEAYKNLHEKGFEIVGISSDEDKEILQKTIKKEEIPWAQYLDGDNGGPKFGEDFQIATIPTMWLIDKKGVLRDLNGREDLEKKVAKLLAEN